MKNKSSILTSLSLLLIMATSSSKMFCQSHNEIKWDAFGLIQKQLSLGYETGIANKSGLELLIGYSPYMRLASFDLGEITEYRSAELSGTILYKIYLDKNASNKHGIGIAPFAELVVRTYIDPEYKQYYFQQTGKEYKSDEPKHVFTGVQLFYKGHIWNNLFIEPSVGPSIDFRHLFADQIFDLNFTIQVKVAYLFNHPTEEKA